MRSQRDAQDLAALLASADRAPAKAITPTGQPSFVHCTLCAPAGPTVSAMLPLVFTLALGQAAGKSAAPPRRRSPWGAARAWGRAR